MGYYVIAIGGTGNKILESIVYGACADIFTLPQAQGEGALIPKLNLLSVDVDAACGNTTRAKRASEYYEDVRQVFKGSRKAHPCFHTELNVQKWNMNLSRRAASVEKMVMNHRRDQLLSKTIFSKTEASLEYSEGFRGHPDLGVLFFADLLKSLDEVERTGQPDEMLDFLAMMRADMLRGETAKVILCGSIFGGTGASGIPSLARFLRERFRDQSALLELGGMLMLPYYKVPASTHDASQQIVVKSSAFLDKARTALQYYGMAGMIRDGEEDANGVFDALYLLGLPPESFITTRNYSTGSQSQQNDAHMLEWLATRCIASFLRTGFRGADAGNIDCYYYQWHTPEFCWQSFDRECELYRARYGAMLKAAAVFFAECYPTIREHIAGSRAHLERIGYCAPYFGKVSRMSAASRARLERALDSLYQFLAFYANWLIQVVRSLPPTMRQKRGEELNEEHAAARYDQLIRADADRLEYDALLRSIGGSAWLGMLKDAQDNAVGELERQQSAVGELRDQLDAWRVLEGDPSQPRRVREAEERLTAMQAALEQTDRRVQRIAADIAQAVQDNVEERYPAPKIKPEDELPRNGLVNAELLYQLYELLNEYGKGAAERDRAAVARCRERLQAGLDKLVLLKVPDRRGMARVVAGLGGGDCDRADPDAALAGFTGMLLQTVMEVEGQ